MDSDAIPDWHVRDTFCRGDDAAEYTEQARLLTILAISLSATSYGLQVSLRNKNHNKISSESLETYEDDYLLSYYCIMARQLNEAEYLGIGYRTYDELNEIAMQIYDYGYFGHYHWTKLDPSNLDKKECRMFHDYKDGDKFHFIITGTAAVNLKKRWLGIDIRKEMEVIKSSWSA